MPTTINSRPIRVGDRVRQTEDCSGTSEGEIYTVRSAGSNQLAIGNGGDSCNCTYQWVLSDDEVPEPTRKFKKGDKVSLLNNHHGQEMAWVGTIFTILKKYGRDNPLGDRDRECGLITQECYNVEENNNFFCENQLELVKPKEKVKINYKPLKKMEKGIGLEKIDRLIEGAEKEAKPDKKNVDIEIVRKDGKTFFRFKIDTRIEKLYAELAEKTAESGKWPGLSFYSIPSMTTSEQYKQKLMTYKLFDNFGDGLIVDGRLNIAWIRTVGGSGDILIKENFTVAEMAQAAQRAAGFIKEHFEDSFRDFRIRATISVEV